MTETVAKPFAISMTGFLLGALALLVVIVQFVAGPFAPQENVGSSLGEFAGQMARDAVSRFVNGNDGATTVARPWDIDRITLTLAMVAAVLGVVLGVIGLIRHEAPRAVGAAFAIGALAIVFQFFATTLMMVLGVLMILGLFAMLGQMFGDIGFGGFGG